MQFQHSTPPQNVRIRRIPTIRLQTLKHSRRNCMRNCEAGAEACCGARGRWQGQAAVLVAAAGPGRASRRHAEPHISDLAPLVRRAPEGPAAVPVGGGGAWPGFEATRRAKLAARTARGRAAAHRHTQRPGPPAPGTPAAPQATTQRKRAAAQRAAARSRSQWSTQRRRAATTSATWTAFRAAPLRRLSPETTRTRPRLPSTAWS